MTAIFVETSAFAKGTLVLPHRMVDFHIVHGPNVVCVPFVFATI